jgi:hypothetical protein
VPAICPDADYDWLLGSFVVRVEQAESAASLRSTRCVAGCWRPSSPRCSRSGQRRQAPRRWTCHSGALVARSCSTCKCMAESPDAWTFTASQLDAYAALAGLFIPQQGAGLLELSKSHFSQPQDAHVACLISKLAFKPSSIITVLKCHRQWCSQHLRMLRNPSLAGSQNCWLLDAHLQGQTTVHSVHQPRQSHST